MGTLCQLRQCRRKAAVEVNGVRFCQDDFDLLFVGRKGKTKNDVIWVARSL